MDIEGISGAATIALASSLVFFLIARSWQLISRSIGNGSNFSGSTMREAAQRFRDEFDRLNSNQSTYLGAGVVFVLLFVAAYVLQARALFIGYPVWQLHILLGALLTGTMLAFCRLLSTALACHRIRLRRDANIAVGHQLQRLADGMGRSYHDVETDAGIIDHLIVGHNGAYAVSVFALPARKNGQVSLQGHALLFAPGGKTRSLVAANARIASLEREFRRLLDHRVRVRSVVAVPGWDITAQGNEEHLLVNERNLPMLSGWRDQADYLLHEDVDALHDLLTARGSKQK
ncbi:MAG: hypothetical protein OEW64_07240 [Gammaproteobacteria bacterium]|nr:hypothetical protein [Gammaproteobacteria bacterium]MDH5303876.1 hypothetical protein [Gammaproteobacteria bacterium]MDH5321479.1 hypothetical protein [Gammaproteobacteria bacterium]